MSAHPHIPWVLALFVAAAHAETPAATNAAKRIYEAKCAKCHRFYDPKAYDEPAWDRWMNSMRRKARLTDAQYEQVSHYLRSVRQAENVGEALKPETRKMEAQ